MFAPSTPAAILLIGKIFRWINKGATSPSFRCNYSDLHGKKLFILHILFKCRKNSLNYKFDLTNEIPGKSDV